MFPVAMALFSSDTATLSGTLPAPLERVYELLTDPARMPLWLAGCRSVSPTTPLKQGSKIKVEFARGAVEFIITDLFPPASFGWLEQGRMGLQTIFKLEFAGSMTTVTMRQIWTPKTLKAWVLGNILRRRSARRMFDTAMVELRRLLGR